MCVCRREEGGAERDGAEGTAGEKVEVGAC